MTWPPFPSGTVVRGFPVNWVHVLALPLPRPTKPSGIQTRWLRPGVVEVSHPDGLVESYDLRRSPAPRTVLRPRREVA